MSLLEWVRVAEDAREQQDDERVATGLESLRMAVGELVPLDRVALIAVDSPERARNEIRAACRRLSTRDPWKALAPAVFRDLVEGLISTVFGLGPLEDLIADETVTEIMVNGTDSVYIERDGRLSRASVSFESDEQVRALIDRILGPLGRRVDESSPMASARLPQGHRVNVVLPPLSLNGPLLTIRAFTRRVMTLAELKARGSFDETVEQFLIWAVGSRRSIAVSGGTGSGKTTLLNALSCHISHEERIITIEDAAELKFDEHPHVVRLEARAPNAEGTGEVTIRELVVNALRMRPDRIIVGECRSDEAIDMLQAMNTGHDGSLTTLHANAPREAVERLVTMVRFAVELPPDAIEAQIGNALDLIVQTARRPGGARCISEIAEVSFDHGRRRCVVRTLYRWEVGQEAGFWLDCPQWVDRLAPMGLADRREVKAWMRSLDLRQSAEPRRGRRGTWSRGLRRSGTSAFAVPGPLRPKVVGEPPTPGLLGACATGCRACGRSPRRSCAASRCGAMSCGRGWPWSSGAMPRRPTPCSRWFWALALPCLSPAGWWPHRRYSGRRWRGALWWRSALR